jgi:hypothetical protein
MELLKEIASVSGKGGLFRILKPTRNGVILETIDEKKTKLAANSSERVSILKEISIYTTGDDSSKPLEEVLMSVYKLFGPELKVSSKSSDAELRGFMEKVVPDYDVEKVYCSDIKKLINWYGILSKNFSEIFTEEKKETSKKKEETPKEEKAEKVEKVATKEKEPVVEEKPKPKAKAKEKEPVKEEKAKAKPKAAAKSTKK